MRPLRAVAAAAALATLASGCQFRGVANLPLPGGAATGPTYTVTAIFADVLDLVPQAGVRVDDVPVGSIDAISLDTAEGADHWRAHVRIKLRRSVVLPANAVARLRQTSLLGEKYVELGPPTDQAPEGRLAPGAVIPESSTGRNPEVEEVFSAFSALLNGGGIGNLQTIAVELTAALKGHEGAVRDTLRRLVTFTGALDSRKGEIVRALDALDRLSASLARQKADIADALDSFTPAVAVLADEREALTALLAKLAKLGTVGSDVIRRSRADTLADLQTLQPTLDTLVGLKTDLATTVTLVDRLATVVPNDIRGDYLNLRIQLDLTTTGLMAPGLSPGVGSTLLSDLGKGQPAPSAPLATATTGPLTGLLLGGLL